MNEHKQFTIPIGNVVHLDGSGERVRYNSVYEGENVPSVQEINALEDIQIVPFSEHEKYLALSILDLGKHSNDSFIEFVKEMQFISDFMQYSTYSLRYSKDKSHYAFRLLPHIEIFDIPDFQREISYRSQKELEVIAEQMAKAMPKCTITNGEVEVKVGDKILHPEDPDTYSYTAIGVTLVESAIQYDPASNLLYTGGVSYYHRNSIDTEARSVINSISVGQNISLEQLITFCNPFFRIHAAEESKL